MTWREAMHAALYGPGGFYARGEPPARHFRTSVHVSPSYAAAIWELLRQVDAGLGHPGRIDLVDIGAGRGELLEQVLAAAEQGSAGAGALGVPGAESASGANSASGAEGARGAGADGASGAGGGSGSGPHGGGAPGVGAPGVGGGRGASVAPGLAERIAACAVEVAPRPAGLDPRIGWQPAPPAGITGLVIASEWLDDVPLDVVELTAAGPAVVQVDPATGAERPGRPPDPADLAWVGSWWPLATCGDRAEVGRSPCEAWAGVIRRIDRGVAVAADYGHVMADRPAWGTLTGYLEGRAVAPLPDGSRDITAHVALDACAAAGQAAGAGETVLTTQRAALRALGLNARRPPLALAAADPERYARALGRASVDAELVDAEGLGGFGWLVQAVRTSLPAPMARLARCDPD
jgi:SAM-dependent MidA family methyltransferase